MPKRVFSDAACLRNQRSSAPSFAQSRFPQTEQGGGRQSWIVPPDAKATSRRFVRRFTMAGQGTGSPQLRHSGVGRDILGASLRYC